MNVSHLEPHCHEPAPGWPGETFERVTAALVAAYRRAATDPAPDTTLTTTQQETATR